MLTFEPFLARSSAAMQALLMHVDSCGHSDTVVVEKSAVLHWDTHVCGFKTVGGSVHDEQ